MPDPGAPRRASQARPDIASAAGRAGAAVFAARLLGLVREQVMAALFGAGMAADAFNVAFRIPNLLRDLFAEGAMPAVFVPTFTEYRKVRGEAEAWAMGRQLMAALFTVALGLSLVFWAVAPALSRMLAPGFVAVPGKIELTVTLMRTMLPFLPAVALAAVASGMLNARSRFVIPALTPAILSVAIVAAGLGLVPVYQAVHEPPILAVGLGVVIGGAAMLAFQLPALYAEGFRFRLEWPYRHPGVVRIGRMMIPAIVGLAASNINQFVSTLLASLFAQGSVSWLWFAFRVVHLPAGVIGGALATVSLTSLAHAAVNRDMASLKSTMSTTLGLMFALTVPASLWLAVIAGPLTALLYEHGRFGPYDTVQTANAIRMYCIGLPAIAASGVFTRAFYSLGDTATPVRATLGSAGVGLAVSLLFTGPLRFLGLAHLGLALSTSLAAYVNLVLLTSYLRRRVGAIGNLRTLGVAVRALAAATVGVLPSAALVLLLADRIGTIGRLGLIAFSVLSSIAIGWWVMKLLKVEELPAIREAVRSALRRSRR